MTDLHLAPSARPLNYSWGDAPQGLPTKVAAIMRECCAKHRIPMRVLHSGARDRATSRCRAEAMRRVRDEITMYGREPSYPQIGQWFGRHHTAVMLAVGAITRKRWS